MRDEEVGEAIMKSAEEWINERRLDLEMEWLEVARRADISRTTLARIRRGKPAVGLIERRFERTMRWKPGSLQRIRDGQPPIPIEDEQPATPDVAHDLAPPETPELRDEGERRLWFALSAVEPLTHDERLAMLQAYRDKRDRSEADDETPSKSAR